MNADKERMRQAYIDGELSASEISTFEATLTPAEKDRVAAEMQFEIALAERLRQGGACPDAVWQRTKTKLAKSRPARANMRARRVYQSVFAVATLATAAAIAVIVMNNPSTTEIDPAAAITLAAATVEELAAMSIISPGEESAEAFLKENGVNLDLEPLNSLAIARVHHDLSVLGARKDTVGDSEIFELLIACCGYPEKIVVALQGSQAAEVIGRAASGQGQVQATRTIGNYIAAVVGDHQAHGLLDVFSARVAKNVAP